jgi:hypothetical protein
MLSFLLKRFSGRHYRKFLEKCRPLVARINELELQYQTLTDDQLRAKTEDFRARIAAAADKRAALEEILPEAFATVKNAARRLRRAQDHGVRPRADVGHGAFRRPADRRHRAPPGPHRRNGDRRRQDPRRDAARSTSTRSPAGTRSSSPSTTTSPAATPSGWATSTASSA